MTLAHTTLLIFLLSGEKNPYLPCVDKLEVGGKEFKFFNLTKLGDERYGRYCSNLMSLASKILWTTNGPKFPHLWTLVPVTIVFASVFSKVK